MNFITDDGDDVRTMTDAQLYAEQDRSFAAREFFTFEVVCAELIRRQRESH